jgi:hypothetical protein
VFHIGVEELLIERSSVHTDANRLVVADCTFHELVEVVIMAISLSDITWIDSILSDRLSHIGILVEEDMTVEVKISDNRGIISLLSQLRDNPWYRHRCGVSIDGDADYLGTSLSKLDDLSNSRSGITGWSIGHRLYNNRMI